MMSASARLVRPADVNPHGGFDPNDLVGVEIIATLNDTGDAAADIIMTWAAPLWGEDHCARSDLFL
jgi:hypothetical protein